MKNENRKTRNRPNQDLGIKVEATEISEIKYSTTQDWIQHYKKKLSSRSWKVLSSKLLKKRLRKLGNNVENKTIQAIGNKKKGLKEIGDKQKENKKRGNCILSTANRLLPLYPWVHYQSSKSTHVQKWCDNTSQALKHLIQKCSNFKKSDRYR